MNTRRIPANRVQKIPRNEWLCIVSELDELMIKQASEASAKVKSPQMQRSTLAAVNAAYSATLRYYTVIAEGGQRNPRTQKEISQLWQQAGKGIRAHSPVLATRLKASNEFWANELTWEKETIQKAWAVLNSIRVSANTLAPDGKVLQRWSTFSSS